MIIADVDFKLINNTYQVHQPLTKISYDKEKIKECIYV